MPQIQCSEGDPLVVTWKSRGFGSQPIEVLRISGSGNSAQMVMGGPSVTMNGATSEGWVDAYSPVNGQTYFPFSRVAAGSVLVFINGQEQKPGRDYSVSSTGFRWTSPDFVISETDDVQASYVTLS